MYPALGRLSFKRLARAGIRGNWSRWRRSIITIALPASPVLGRSFWYSEYLLIGMGFLCSLVHSCVYFRVVLVMCVLDWRVGLARGGGGLLSNRGLYFIGNLVVALVAC